MIKSCFKLIASSLVCVMAFCSKADEQRFSWTIDIDGIPDSEQAPVDLQAYLVDSSGNNIAYVDVSMYVPGWDLKTEAANANAINSGAGTTLTGGQIIIGTSAYSGKQAYNITASMKTPVSHYEEPVKIKVVGKDTTGGTVFETTGKWMSQSTLYSSVNLMSVPEPTSGLLVLMGLAGLALKRKKAA